MTIDYDKLINWNIPEVEQQLSKRDTMLYALGTGLGFDPVDENQLRFVYEKQLQALPSMAIVLGYPGPWHADPATGVDRSKVVHGEQGFTIHQPLPVEGTLIGRTRVTGLLDKGEGKGALILTETTVSLKASSQPICTLTSTTFARANGGFGGPSGPARPVHELPTSAPDEVCDLPTLPQQALIYRLSGDYNPLHAEPAAAQKSGYRMPILHGRCTFGVAAHAILKTLCGYDPSRFKSMEARFSAPVFPGESIRTEMWQNGTVVSFRSLVAERNAVVINNGRAEIAPR
jgi:acyl dehydratase